MENAYRGPHEITVSKKWCIDEHNFSQPVHSSPSIGSVVMGVLVDPLEVRLPHFHHSNNKVKLNFWNFHTPGNYMSTSMSLCFFSSIP